MKKGEFDFIESIKEEFAQMAGAGDNCGTVGSLLSEEGSACGIVAGIGDDCAVISQDSDYETLVSTDLLVESTHFLRDDITAYQLGWKSAAVNFSDLAAMGGEPVGSFLAIALPADVSDEWAEDFIRGYKDISSRYGVPLLGGDTTGSPGVITVCVTVMGRCLKGKAKLRSGALPGDLICVTGTLGDSGLGLDALLRKRALASGTDRCAADSMADSEAYAMRGIAYGVDDVEAELPYAADTLIERHYMPRPRLNEGLILSEYEGVHAMMDVSDGVASDLGHILKASICDAVVDASLLPLSTEAFAYCKRLGLVPQKYALCSGEDYELLFTVDPQTEPSLDVPHTVIGRILPHDNGEIHWENLPDGLSSDSLQGFRHF